MLKKKKLNISKIKKILISGLFHATYHLLVGTGIIRKHSKVVVVSTRLLGLDFISQSCLLYVELHSTT